jgi:hypothetical protein
VEVLGVGGVGGDPPAASGRGTPIKQVARVMGCSKNTVKRALATAGPRGTNGGWWRIDRGRGRAAGPGAAATGLTTPATVIAERIGWTRGLTVLKDRVRVSDTSGSLPAGHQPLCWTVR